MTDIASLGVKVESNLKTFNKDMEKTISLSEKVTDATKKMESQMAGVSSTTKNVINEEAKRQKSVDNLIKSLTLQEIRLKEGKIGLDNYKASILGATDAEKKQIAALNTSIKSMQDANAAAKNHDSVLGSLIARLSALGAAYFGVQAIKNFASSLIDTAKIMDSYKYSLLAVSENSTQAAETYEYLRKEADRLGLSLTTQEKAFTGFAAAAKQSGLRVEETRSIYTGLMEAMTAIHRSPEEASQALKAFQDMLSKGTIQAEELKKQLGNALPGAMAYMSDATGKSTAELMKMMEQGILPAKEGLIVLSDYLSNKFQLSAEGAANSVQGSLNKMENAWYELKAGIVEAMGSNTTGIIKDVTDTIKNMTEEIKKPEVQKSLKEIADAIKVIGEVTLTTTQYISKMILAIADVDFAKNDTNEFVRSLEVYELAKKGVLDFAKVDKATTKERIAMLDELKAKQDEFIISLIDSAKSSETATDTFSKGWLRVSGAQVLSNKEMFAARGLTQEQGEELKKLTDKIKEQAEVAGKTDIQIMEGNLRKLTSDEALIKSQLDLMKTTEAKNKAVKDADKAAREAESERERAAEKAISDEKARQGRVDAIINKMKEQIATYKQATEVSAEYQLIQEGASPAEIKLAKDLANTIDALKAKTKAQEAYKKVMDKTAPDPIEMNRQKAIEAVNQAVKDGAVLNGTYAESLAQINTHFDKLEMAESDKALKEMGNELDRLTKFDGSSFGNTIADGINNAMISMNKLNDVFENNAKAQELIIKLQKEISTGKGSPEERKEKLEQIDKAESKMIENQISGYRQLFGTASQLFKENSREREVMHNIEMAFAAAEIAMNLEKTISAAYTAIMVQGTGDPYSAFARIAAMTALAGGIVAAAGGSLSGGGSASALSVSASNTQGTGTVMGNPSEKSQSANNALEFMKDIEAKQYNELRDINKGVVDLNNNITNLVTSIVRTGAGTGDMGIKTGTSTSTSELQNISSKGFLAAANLMSLGTISASQAIASLTKNIPVLGNITADVSDWINDTVSSFSNAVFGGTKKTSILAQGLEVSTAKIGDLLEGAAVDIQKFADIKIKKSGGIFGSDKTYLKTITESLTPDEESIKIMFTNVFKNVGETMVAISKELNMGDDKLKEIYSYVFDIGKIDLKGMDTEQINEAISSVINTASDEAVTALFGELIGKYVQVGEALLETAIRVVSERAVVLDILEMTGQGFKDSDIAAYSLEITQSLISVAGGIKELQDASATYYDKFFTDSEKQIRLQGQLSETMTSMGQSMPTTRDGLRKIVESLDLTTEAGQRGYVTLLGLSESFDSVFSKIEADNEKKLELELQIMNLTGKGAEALAIQRQKEIDSLSEANKPLQERIYALQDEAEALKKTQEKETKLIAERQKTQSINDARYNLEIQLMKLTGRESEALALSRKKELASMNEALRPLQEKVWELEDLKSVVSVDYKAIAETQKQNIQKIVKDGVETFKYLMESSDLYNKLVVDLDNKSGDLIEKLNEFEYAIGGSLHALSLLKDTIIRSIDAINPGEIFKSMFETTGSSDVFSSLDKFVLDVKDRISVFGDLISEAGIGVQVYMESVGDINAAYMKAQEALSNSVDLTAVEQAKVAEAFDSTVYALAQTSSEIMQVREAFLKKEAMQKALSDSLNIFEDIIIKKAGESIVPVIELNISKDIFSGLVSSGAIDKVAASIVNVTEGSASEFQASYAQLIKLLTEGTITTDEFNSVFNLTKDIFSGAIQPIKTLTEDLEKRFSLEMEILRLTGKETEAVMLEREKELATLGDTLKPLQEKIWLLQDEKIATELVVQAEKDKQQKEKEILEERAELTIRLLQAEGKDLEVLAITRAKERLALDETNRVLYDSIILLEDKNKAEEALIEAQKKAEEERLELQKKAEEEKKALLEKNLSESEDMLKKSIDNQISFYQTMADEANRIFEEAKGLLERSFTAEQETITKKHELLIAGLTTRLEEAQTAASDLESVFNSLSEARKSMEVESAGLTYKAVQKQLTDALSMAKAGDVSGAKSLVPNLGILTSQGAEKYGSQEEFKRDFFKTYNALSELEKLTGTQLTEQQQVVKNLETQISQADENNKLTLEMLQSQYDAVIGVDKTVISFEDAVRQYQRAQYDADGANTLLKVQTELLNNQLNMLLGISSRVLSVDNAVANFVIAQNAYNFNNSTALSAQNEAAYKQLNVLYSIDSGISAMHEALVGLSKDTSEVNTSSNASTVPIFGNGGYHSGGPMIVGDRGPEVLNAPPAMITSNNDLKSIMSNEEVVAELKAMRSELARANFEIVKNSGESKKTLREWQEIGILTRTA